MDKTIKFDGIIFKNKIKTKSFYDKVKKCKHNHLKDTGSIYPSSCDCFGISEVHCLDCGAWFNRCRCGRYNSIAGKSLMQRRDSVAGNKDWRDVVDNHLL